MPIEDRVFCVEYSSGLGSTHECGGEQAASEVIRSLMMVDARNAQLDVNGFKSSTCMALAGWSKYVALFGVGCRKGPRTSAWTHQGWRRIHRLLDFLVV